MRKFQDIFFLTGLLFLCLTVAGQGESKQRASSDLLDPNPHYYKSHDTVWIYSGICKPLKVVVLTGAKATAFLNRQPGAPKVPLLTIHGNIQYDFTYRSWVDTPFSQTNFAQHTVQSTLDVLIRNTYPFRITLRSRQSNSPYFQDITDVNVQFNRSAFIGQIKDQLQHQLVEAPTKIPLSAAERKFEEKEWQVQSLQRWLEQPVRIQDIIREREKMAAKRILAQQSPNAIAENIPGRPRDGDSAVNRSFPDSLAAEFAQAKDSLNKLIIQLEQYRGQAQKVKGSFNNEIAKLKSALSKVKTVAELKSFIAANDLKTESLPKGWQALTAIQTFGVGRTWVDYSDLTVKNISLTGFNIEFNPSNIYVAVTAGKVNYRFRDFIIRNQQASKQSLYMLRAGVGQKDGNHLIFSWYDGKRNLLNVTGSSIIELKPERVLGMAAESRISIDHNTFFVFEVAKSSFHSTNQSPDRNLAKNVLDFSNRSNEAYSIKIQSELPRYQARVTGYYRKTGENFQSFNLQPVNVDQEAYAFNLKKSFWRKRLSIDAGVRKNDFNSPFIYPRLSSKTIFKSAQASLKLPKYPFISVGYYPSSQLTVLDNNIIAESQYNTLSAVMSHAYRAKSISMNTSMMLLRFYNNSQDTGFIYFNATSFSATHFIFFRNLQMQTGITLTSQRDLQVTTLDQSFDVRVNQWLGFNGAVKYNRLNHQQTLWGGSAGLTLVIGKIGTIQGNFDKSYLPGTNRNLLPVSIGRLTYYKSF